VSADVNLFGPAISEEAKLIKAVLDPNAEVSLVIPPEVTPAQIHDHLLVCCKALGRLDRAKSKLLWVIGRLLILCQENPEVYLERGIAKDFKHFLRDYVEKELGVSRSASYLAMQTIRQWPRLSIEEYAAVGVGKFAILNTFSSQNGISSSKLLSQARKLSTRQLREWAVQTGRMERGETTPAVITIGCSQKTKRLWEHFIRNAKTIQAAESDNAAAILEACIAEFCAEHGIGEE
jgi:hypothetical protein